MKRDSVVFCVKYVENKKRHKWIINPVYFDELPIINIKPVKGLCKHRNVLVCPLYRKNH